MKRGRGRPKKEPDRTPLIHHTPNQFAASMSNRDSDASYGTNRQSYSSSITHNIPITDKSHQISSIRMINEYLAFHSVPFSLKAPLPSATDIKNTIRFICSRLDWATTEKLEEDLPDLLKHLKCPYKLNKSALKTPGIPSTWPVLLAIMHWLVQIAYYNDHVSEDSSMVSATTKRSFLQDNAVLMFALESYSYYIDGDDEAVDALDCKFVEDLEQKKEAVVEEVGRMEEEVLSLEGRVKEMRGAPSAKEVLEREKAVLEEDQRKFHAYIDELKSNISGLEKDLERMEKELEVKVSEDKRICEENEELKKSLEGQMFNSRDVERMRREIQAYEREISETEVARNEWEEKSWELDETLGHKIKELESLSIKCNQAIRRLKIGDDMQYKLNIKGSKPADILGNDYKSTLKPALIAFAEDLKKSSMANLEEHISFQQQSQDNQSKLKDRRSQLTELQSQLDALESQRSLLEKEIQDYTSMCHMEAKRLAEEYEHECQKLDTMESKAEYALKSSTEKLQDVIKQSEEKTQMCARELLMLMDSVSKYKERMETKVLNMKKALSETMEAVTNAYKNSLAADLSTL